MKREILLTTGLFIVIIIGLGMITSLGKDYPLGNVSKLNTSSSSNLDDSTSISMKTMSNDIAGKTMWSTIAGTTYALAVSDFNADGIDDVFAGTRNPRTFDGLTGAQIWSNTNNTILFDRFITSALGNFNNDGIDDVLIGYEKENTTYAIDGATGDLLWSSTAANDSILKVAVGDFNNDGTDDALVGSKDYNVYALNGLTGEQLWNNTDPSGYIQSIAIGDFNGDNIDDALLGYDMVDKTIYALNGRTGEQIWNNTQPEFPIVSLAVFDINEDGVDDVFAGDGSTLRAIDGSTGSSNWNLSIGGARLALGDVNGNGKPVVIAASYADSNVYAIDAYTGKIQWTNRDPTDGYYLTDIAIGDVNGDGIDDVITGGTDSTVYAISGIGGVLLWKNTDSNSMLSDIKTGDFNSDGTLDVVVSNHNYYIYVITGYTPPTTSLEATLTLSKTYVNLTNDWTIARIVVTNIGPFTAFSVFVVIYFPDGSDDLMAWFDTILPSRSKQSRYNLTSGSGLPTTKVVNALEVSYTVSVLVGSYNTPWLLVSTPIIVDPPLDEKFSQEELAPNNYPSPVIFQIEAFAMGMIAISFVGALGALVFGFYKKRILLSKNISSGD